MANANYNYSLNIGATIKSTDNIKTQLDNFASKYTLKINVQLSQNELSKLNSSLTQATQAIGRLQQATIRANANLNAVNGTSRALATSFQGVASGVASVNGRIDNLTTATQHAGRAITTSMDGVQTEAVETTNALYGISQQLDEIGSRGGRGLDNLRDRTRDLTRETLNFSSVIHRVFEFYVASLPIRVFEAAVRETIDTIKEFDDALTEFKKVSDLAGDSLQSYTEKLGELGKATAKTRTEMVAMATEFTKSGFSENDAATLANIASLYQNIADEELEAGDAANFIIAQMKAFNIDAEDSIHIIDAVNEVKLYKSFCDLNKQGELRESFICFIY